MARNINVAYENHVASAYLGNKANLNNENSNES